LRGADSVAGAGVAAFAGPGDFLVDTALRAAAAGRGAAFLADADADALAGAAFVPAAFRTAAAFRTGDAFVPGDAFAISAASGTGAAPAVSGGRIVAALRMGAGADRRPALSVVADFVGAVLLTGPADARGAAATRFDTAFAAVAFATLAGPAALTGPARFLAGGSAAAAVVGVPRVRVERAVAARDESSSAIGSP